LEEVETQQEQAIMDMDQLHDNRNSIVANMQESASVAGSQVPAVVGTSGESTVAAK